MAGTRRDRAGARGLAAFGAALLLLVVSASFAGATGVSAQGRTLEMRDFHSSVTVTPSGRLHVSERITFRFNGSWNGIYRTIPIKYETPRGFGYDLARRVTGVRV